eukprot:scaffold22541_cov42-Cyclotella_meneghiniana.AAC.3
MSTLLMRVRALIALYDAVYGMKDVGGDTRPLLQIAKSSSSATIRELSFDIQCCHRSSPNKIRNATDRVNCFNSSTNRKHSPCLLLQRATKSFTAIAISSLYSDGCNVGVIKPRNLECSSPLVTKRLCRPNNAR